MRAIYVGILTDGTTSRLRFETLKQLLPQTDWMPIDTDQTFLKDQRLWRSLAFRWRTGPAVARINAAVLSQAQHSADLVWVDKGVYLYPRTVQHLRKLAKRLVYYTPDTSFYANGSRFFDRSIDHYDLVVSTKSFEERQFHQRIAPAKLLLVNQSYDSELHRPSCSVREKRKETVLIGLCEPDRERCVEILLAHGISVRIGGHKWDRFVRRHAGSPNLHFEGQRVFGGRYAGVLGQAAVGLGLLSRRFPELHTTRTFEIPACGTVLATERNAETTTFFSEDEALFFDDYEELAGLILSIMSDEPRLERMAEAGRNAVQTGNNSNRGILREILHVAGISVP